MDLPSRDRVGNMNAPSSFRRSGRSHSPKRVRKTSSNTSSNTSNSSNRRPTATSNNTSATRKSVSSPPPPASWFHSFNTHYSCRPDEAFIGKETDIDHETLFSSKDPKEVLAMCRELYRWAAWAVTTHWPDAEPSGMIGGGKTGSIMQPHHAARHSKRSSSGGGNNPSSNSRSLEKSMSVSFAFPGLPKVESGGGGGETVPISSRNSSQSGGAGETGPLSIHSHSLSSAAAFPSPKATAMSPSSSLTGNDTGLVQKPCVPLHASGLRSRSTSPPRSRQSSLPLVELFIQPSSPASAVTSPRQQPLASASGLLYFYSSNLAGMTERDSGSHPGISPAQSFTQGSRSISICSHYGGPYHTPGGTQHVKTMEEGETEDGFPLLNGKYIILGEAGRGSFGTVDLAVGVKTQEEQDAGVQDKMFAIKAINKSLLKRRYLQVLRRRSTRQVVTPSPAVSPIAISITPPVHAVPPAMMMPPASSLSLSPMAHRPTNGGGRSGSPMIHQRRTSQTNMEQNVEVGNDNAEFSRRKNSNSSSRIRKSAVELGVARSFSLPFRTSNSNKQQQPSNKESPQQQQQLTTFHKEIAVMKRLHHKNIVPLVEVIDDPAQEKIYMVMPFIGRGAFLQVSAQGTATPLDVDVWKAYLREAAAALGYLHRKHIVHRDIKPDNLLLGNDNHLYLADFGVSEMFSEDAAAEGQEQQDQQQHHIPSSKQQLVTTCEGTPMFLAPELLSLSPTVEGVAGKPLDVWALGMTFFCAAFGSFPFVASSFSGVRDELNCFISVRSLMDAILDNHGHELSQSSKSDTTRVWTSPLPSTAFKKRVLELSGHGGEGPTTAFDDLVDLLDGMLDKDPETRFTVRQVRKHRLLTGRDRRESSDLPLENMGTFSQPPSGDFHLSIETSHGGLSSSLDWLSIKSSTSTDTTSTNDGEEDSSSVFDEDELREAVTTPCHQPRAPADGCGNGGNGRRPLVGSAGLLTPSMLLLSNRSSIAGSPTLLSRDTSSSALGASKACLHLLQRGRSGPPSMRSGLGFGWTQDMSLPRTSLPPMANGMAVIASPPPVLHCAVLPTQQQQQQASTLSSVSLPSEIYRAFAETARGEGKEKEERSKSEESTNKEKEHMVVLRSSSPDPPPDFLSHSDRQVHTSSPVMVPPSLDGTVVGRSERRSSSLV